MAEEVGDGAQSPEKTFTQAELDRLIEDRLRRERSKYSDYEELKSRAAKLGELENASKTEAERQIARLAEIEKALGLRTQENERLTAELTAVKRANLTASVASRLNAIDPQDANILAAVAAIDPAGANAEQEIEKAITALAKQRAYLFRQQGTQLAEFNPGGGSGELLSDQQRVQQLLGSMGMRGYGPLGP